MQLKRIEIMNILEKLNSFTGEHNKYFIYHVSKVKSELEKEKNAIIEMSKPSMEFIKYEKERQKIILKHVEMKEGVPVEVDGFYKIQQNKEDICKEELNILLDKYKTIVNKRQEEIKELERILEEQVDLSITLIPLTLRVLQIHLSFQKKFNFNQCLG